MFSNTISKQCRLSLYFSSVGRCLRVHCVAPGRGGVGVRSLTSSFDRTTDGSLGTRPVALKLETMLAFEKAVSKTFANDAMNAFLSIRPM